MIGSIAGKVLILNPTQVLVEVNGIGYEINISLPTYAAIQDMQNVLLYTHQQILEDAHVMWGFATTDEKQLFKLLISVNGVGPSGARTILSATEPQDLLRWLAEENVALLQKMKGVGPKTAQRLVLELKDKVAPLIKQDVLFTDSGNKMPKEALTALMVLGYPKPQAEKAVQRVMAEQQTELNVEAIIKLALKLL